MEKKIMETHDTLATLFMYFIAYLIFSNVIMYFAILIIPSVEMLYLMQFYLDLFVLIFIFQLCKALFKDVKYSCELSVFFKIPKYYAGIILTNILISVPIMIVSSGQVSNNQQAVEMMISSNIMYSCFSITIFAPIVEELVFRGVIYKNLRMYFGVVSSIIVSSTCFALMHFMVSLITGDINDMLFLPLYLVPSVYLCIFYEKSNNIFAPIYLHAFNNLIGIAMALSF
ncbi:MAG: type II CAAX endopeptidase family protein [Clostridia bacterium]